jgi:hypothetical protein
MVPTMRGCMHAGGRRVYRRSLGGGRARCSRAIAAGRRLAALRPLHGAGAVRARPGLLRRDERQFGPAGSGSDFVTAPELSPLFGRALARQVAQALAAAQADDRLRVRRRLGRAGGAAAGRALGERVRRYAIVDLSAPCASGSAERLARFGDRVRWLDALPGRDARRGRRQRGARRDAGAAAALGRPGAGSSAAWRARATASPGPTGPPLAAPAGGRRLRARHRHRDPSAGRGLRRTLAERLQRGAAFFIDYGFPEAEYYHPQRQRRHADVPPRAPRRHRPAGRRGRQGHHRARRLHRHRAGRAGRRAGRAGLHLAGALPAELRPARDAAGRRPAHAARTRRSCSPSTRWASCSRSSAWPRHGALDRSASARATARTRSERLPACAGCSSSCSPSWSSTGCGLAAPHRPGQAAGRLQLPPGRPRLVRAAGQRCCSA